MADVDFRIPLSVFENKDDNRPAHHEMAWQALAQRLCKYDERPVKDGRAWSPVTYLPGTTRGKANVDTVHALVLDVDHANVPSELLTAWEYVAHTTFRHTADDPRWRVIVPLSEPISGVDWPAFWLRANAFFGGCVDPATKDSSRIFYLPSCPPGAEHQTVQHHGAPLAPAELPEVPVYTAPPVQRGGHKRPVLEHHLSDWAARFLINQCQRLTGMPRDSGRNNACNRLAHTLGGLVAEPLHQLTEELVSAQVFDACVSNLLVADDGENAVRATIRSGFESGLLRPWSPADQDPLVPARAYEPPTERPQLYAVQDLHLDIVRMSEVTVESIDWLWRGRLARGKLTLLMGDPGLGKSLITHWLAARVSTGGEWPDGGVVERGAAIVFTIEDALSDTVKPRLIAAGADMNRVIAVRGVVNPKASLDARMFALEEHVALLEELVTDEGASLIVMDPVSSYLGANVNTHKESDVRRVLGLLSLMAERTNVSVLMVIHLNKGKDIAALNRATGSVAFPAVSRIVLGVVDDPLDDDGRRRLLLPLKCNVARKPAGLGYRIETAPTSSLLPAVGEEDRPPVLIWDDEPVLEDMNQALDRGTLQDRNATEEAVYVLGQIYQNNGYQSILATDIMRQLRDAGVSTSGSVLTAAKKQLGIKSRQDGMRGPWSWLPPRRRVMSPRARAGEPSLGIGRQGSPESHGDPEPSSPSSPGSPLSFDSDSSHAPARAREASETREVRLCPRCQQHMDIEVYSSPGHACTDTTGLPAGLCPIHRVLFSLHDCDAL